LASRWQHHEQESGRRGRTKAAIPEYRHEIPQLHPSRELWVIGGGLASRLRSSNDGGAALCRRKSLSSAMPPETDESP
jgi:hypothetical protein